MPNTRRRRFSVQNDIAGRDSSKMQNGLQNSQPDPANHVFSYKSNKTKNKSFPNTSKNLPPLEIVAECESSSSISSIKNPCTTIDKYVTASSSNIDFCNNLKDDAPLDNLQETNTKNEQSMKESRITGGNAPMRRDKYPRQHRIKVRSPKRRTLVLDNHQKPNDTEIYKQSIGTVPINWNLELELCTVVANVTLNETAISNSALCSAEDDGRPSDHSFDDMCRICHGGEALSTDLGPLISACSCRGTVGRVHVKCLERWLTESGKSRCELCGTKYATKRVHRYGVPRALVMWILSQNAKQLMVDSLGIMLMSPLAVLAAWLSGRTLAGLMMQESHVTPWPLASTFVLACMTLVCYYCWIVSAATRHALGWWIWYRSQYEVRLQFQTNEE